jgi:hypothetical protein
MSEERDASAEEAEMQAIRAFLNTNSWDETRAVLEREQALLLTESASRFLLEALEHARQSDDLEMQQRGDYLEAHLALLHRAREVGISAAWEEFQATYMSREDEEEGAAGQITLTEDEAERAAQDAAFLVEKLGLDAGDPEIPAVQEHLRQKLDEARQPPDPEQVLAATIYAFLSARSWEETLAFLKRNQALLLSEPAREFLSRLVGQAWRIPDEDDARYMEVHLKLLTRARQIGLDAAWAEFEAVRQADGMPDKQ